MKIWLTFIIMLMIFEPEGGGEPTSYRRYQRVMIPPYSVGEGTTVSFEFFNTYGDDIQLTWRFTNTKYQQLLVYSQAYPPRMSIQKHVDLPSFIFDGQQATLSLQASRPGFTSAVNLIIYPRVILTVTDVSQPLLSAPTISRIDAGGWIQYEREHLSFIGMPSRQFHDVYSRYDVTPMRLRLHTVLAKDLIIQDANLLIANHPSLDGLNLLPSGFRHISLIPSLIGDTIQFQFPQLYVHPQTLSPSQILIPGYQPTRFLFFPLHAYSALKEMPMTLTLTLIHFHEIQLSYSFTYDAFKAVFGHCLMSQTCVKIYA